MTDDELKNKEHLRKRSLEKLAKMRPLDDTLMRRMFKDNIELAQGVLRIILDKPDLIIESLKTQVDMKQVGGARSICLDAYGIDSKGTRYDIEVQKASYGADIHRARYYSSVLDVENLRAGQEFNDLPEIYIIFITEKDTFKDGKGIHLIERYDVTNGKAIKDGSHIIYVNGQYRDESDLGLLMHDFNCKNASEMHFSFMADSTRYLKETQKGVESMCDIMEEFIREERTEASNEAELRTSAEIAKSLYDGGMPVELIAKHVKRPIETVKEWLGIAA